MKNKQEQITIVHKSATPKTKLNELIRTTMHVVPEKKRKNSFWFDGHVATVDLGKVQVYIVAEGEVSVSLLSNIVHKGDVARANAKTLFVDDTHIKDLYDDDKFSNSNWFGYKIVIDGGEEINYDSTIASLNSSTNSTDSNLDEAIKTATQILIDEFIKFNDIK